MSTASDGSYYKNLSKVPLLWYKESYLKHAFWKFGHQLSLLKSYYNALRLEY